MEAARNHPDEVGLELVVPAVPERVGELREAARAFAIARAAPLAGAIALAVTEAATNAVLHAYRDRPAGGIRLSATAEDGRLTYVISDAGLGLTPHVAGGSHWGLGLPIIAQLSDHFELSDGDGSGTRVLIAFDVDLD